VVVFDLLKDFDFGDVGEWVDCGGAIAILTGGAIAALRCKMSLKDFVVVELAIFLDGADGEIVLLIRVNHASLKGELLIF
jgi:limonene-1,2-epoxide hydrolase